MLAKGPKQKRLSRVNFAKVVDEEVDGTHKVPQLPKAQIRTSPEQKYNLEREDNIRENEKNGLLESILEPRWEILEGRKQILHAAAFGPRSF
jgi:hypothetical protein